MNIDFDKFKKMVKEEFGLIVREIKKSNKASFKSLFDIDIESLEEFNDAHIEKSMVRRNKNVK